MPKKVIFDKKNVLVTGGAGFIGSHLCDRLVENCKVICLDNFITGSERNIDHLLSNPNFVFINHDISQSIELESLPELKKFKIEFQGIQEIYNLACPMSPDNFMKDRLDVVRANSVALLNLLDMAVKYQSKFLQFSSSVVYGPRYQSEFDYKVKEEDLRAVDNLSERSAYDEGKRFSETVVYNYCQVKEIDAKIVRLFRIYGPRMKLADGQMIPDFVDAALDNKDLMVYGDENFSSSFCYIDDALDAIFKIMESDLPGPINIGSDVDVNLTDLAMMIIEQTKSQSNIKYNDKKLLMSELVLPDTRLAREKLHWMPVVTLENGLKKTIFALQADKRLHKFKSD